MKRAVTEANLGAWVIKCNPRFTPVEPFQLAGRAKSSWCVADDYRSRLMRPGHRVLFWVSAHPQRGIWGAGRVTEEVSVRDGHAHIAVSIPLFDEPLTVAHLTQLPGLRSMEMFRSPQQANPSWVSTSELTLLQRLFPESRSSAD
jgi:hypothetical protein